MITTDIIDHFFNDTNNAPMEITAGALDILIGGLVAIGMEDLGDGSGCVMYYNTPIGEKIAIQILTEESEEKKICYYVCKPDF